MHPDFGVSLTINSLTSTASAPTAPLTSTALTLSVNDSAYGERQHLPSGPNPPSRSRPGECAGHPAQHTGGPPGFFSVPPPCLRGVARLPVSPMHQLAAALIHRTERLLGRDGAFQLVVIPRLLRLQPVISPRTDTCRGSPARLPHPALAEQRIVGRHRLHLLDHRQPARLRLVRRRLPTTRLQIMRHRRILRRHARTPASCPLQQRARSAWRTRACRRSCSSRKVPSAARPARPASPTPCTSWIRNSRPATFWPPFWMPNSAACLMQFTVSLAAVGEADHLRPARMRLHEIGGEIGGAGERRQRLPQHLAAGTGDEARRVASPANDRTHSRR